MKVKYIGVACYGCRYYLALQNDWKINGYITMLPCRNCNGLVIVKEQTESTATANHFYGREGESK